MKLHHYNEMVAYLTRPRQKYENGGPVIPEPKPEEAIHAGKLKDFEAKVNLGVQGIRGGMEKDLIIQMLEEQKDLIGLSNEDALMVISNFMERLNRGLKANGGRIKAADGIAVQTLNPVFPTKDPTDTKSFKPLDLPGAIITPLAIGAGAKRIKDIFFSDVKETGDGIDIGPDAGEMEKERQRIAESLKPGKTYIPETGPIHTGSPRPEIKKEEPPVSGGKIDIPLTTGGSEIPETKKEDLIFTFAKDKKEVKKKLGAIEPYRGADFIGTSTKKDRTKDKEFVEAFIEFKEKYYGGNEKAAIEKGLGLNREYVRGIILRTTGGKSPKKSTVTEEIITTEVPKNPIRYIDATTEVKRDQNYFKDFLTKENKNEYMSPQNIANVLDFKFGDGSSERLAKSERDAFIQELNKLDIKSKEVPGKRYKTYKLSDVVNVLTEKNKDKRVKGEVMSQTERMEVENRLDPELYSAVLNTAKSRVNALLKEEGLKVDLEIAPRYIIDDIGHTVSIKETDKFPKLFKNSNVNKINSLVYEDPLINQEVKKVTGYESKHNKWFKELNDMVGKEITKDQRTRLKDIKEQMEDNYSEFVETVGNFDELKAALKKARPDLKISDSYIKYLTGHTDRLGQIDINIPKVGEKFKSEDIFVDMSNVDEKYIIGYVDKINPKAKLFSDLSPKEKEIYEANVIAQNAEILGDYFRKIGVPESEIKSMQDEFYYPTPSREWKVRKATGGRVYGKYAKQIAGIS